MGFLQTAGQPFDSGTPVPGSDPRPASSVLHPGPPPSALSSPCGSGKVLGHPEAAHQHRGHFTWHVNGPCPGCSSTDKVRHKGHQATKGGWAAATLPSAHVMTRVLSGRALSCPFEYSEWAKRSRRGAGEALSIGCPPEKGPQSSLC